MSELLKIGLDGIVPARLTVEKSSSQFPNGELNGYASVYNIVDDDGDVALPGAFKRTIARWKQAGRYIPLMDGHTFDNDKVLGSFRNLNDDGYGFRVNAGFSSSDLAQKRRQDVKDGHISGLSIFGDIVNQRTVKVDGKSRRGLAEVHLLHIALTPGPKNFFSIATAKSFSNEVVDEPWTEPTEKSNEMCALVKGDDKLLPHHMPDGKANINAVRKALDELSLMSGLTEDERQKAQEHLEEHVEQFNKSRALPELWVADMRAALTISNVTAQKSAVDTLIADYIKTKKTTILPKVENEPEVEKSDAAQYALDLISGHGEDPSGGNSVNDSLADLLGATNHETDKVISDLDALERELLGGNQ